MKKSLTSIEIHCLVQELQFLGEPAAHPAHHQVQAQANSLAPRKPVVE